MDVILINTEGSSVSFVTKWSYARAKLRTNNRLNYKPVGKLGLNPRPVALKPFNIQTRVPFVDHKHWLLTNPSVDIFSTLFYMYSKELTQDHKD